MKLIFVLAVAASAIMLLVQGAPQVTSEELGKAVEELQELLKAEAAKIAQSAQIRESASAQWPPYKAQSSQIRESASAQWPPYYKAQSAQRPEEAQSANHPRLQVSLDL